jgi:hypothetical protein
MNMRLSLHEDEKEERRHFSAIQLLARNEGVNEEEISRIYGEVLEEYRKEAKVEIYLPILVSKKVS